MRRSRKKEGEKFAGSKFLCNFATALREMHLNIG
jgi:hypothetical protein